MKRRRRWLRTDEREDAVRSLQWAATVSETLDNEPQNWKWELVALHNATQGFMVLALSRGNGLLALRPKIAAKWLKAYASHGTISPQPFPADKLDEFLNLYAKIKEPKYFGTPFVPGTDHDRGMQQLNDFRNKFIHFTPKGWSLELAGLPGLIVTATDVVSWCANDSGTFAWYKQIHVKQTAAAVRRLRRVAKSLCSPSRMR